MKTLQIEEHRIRVEGSDGQSLWVARYDDAQGPYFLNEHLERQRAIVGASEPREISEVAPKLKVKYTFWMEYWLHDEVHRDFISRKAHTREEALRKIEKFYGNRLIEIEEV